jgi:recombination protein RecA
MGNRTRLKVVKNKVAAPFTECEFDIMYAEGISKTGSLVDLGVEHGILEKKGAWISYKGDLIGQGREAAKQHLMDNLKQQDEIKDAILEKVNITIGNVIASSGKDEDEGEEG